MEKLQGVVNKLRFSTHVSGGGDHTSTDQIAIFEIDRRPVELSLPFSIIIDNGDEVRLAGVIRKGVFNAMAYRNLANNASGKGRVFINILLGTIFTIVGLPLAIAVIFSGISLGGIMVSAVGTLFSFIGINVFRAGLQYSSAYKIVSRR